MTVRNAMQKVYVRESEQGIVSIEAEWCCNHRPRAVAGTGKSDATRHLTMTMRTMGLLCQTKTKSVNERMCGINNTKREKDWKRGVAVMGARWCGAEMVGRLYVKQRRVGYSQLGRLRRDQHPILRVFQVMRLWLCSSPTLDARRTSIFIKAIPLATPYQHLSCATALQPSFLCITSLLTTMGRRHRWQNAFLTSRRSVNEECDSHP